MNNKDDDGAFLKIDYMCLNWHTKTLQNETKNDCKKLVLFKFILIKENWHFGMTREHCKTLYFIVLDLEARKNWVTIHFA